ncbi:MAG: DsrE/DsrF/DrsH-like family protein [Candidatus Zhuqueibacterota bacterium]
MDTDWNKSLELLTERVGKLEAGRENKLSLIVFSGELDKLLAAFVIATGAAASGMKVTMFFTFWATSALRDRDKKPGRKDFFSRIFGALLPKGTSRLKLSRLNMAGLGTSMMKHLMRKKKVASIEEMLQMAGNLGIQIYICEMSMRLMGLQRDEMMAYPLMKFCGVTTYLAEAQHSNIQLFI